MYIIATVGPYWNDSNQSYSPVVMPEHCKDWGSFVCVL